MSGCILICIPNLLCNVLVGLCFACLPWPAFVTLGWILLTVHNVNCSKDHIIWTIICPIQLFRDFFSETKYYFWSFIQFDSSCNVMHKLSSEFQTFWRLQLKMLVFFWRRVKYTQSRKPLEFYCYAVRWTASFLFCFQSHSCGSCRGFQLYPYAHISCDIVQSWQVLTRAFNSQSASIAALHIITLMWRTCISEACKEMNIFTYFFNCVLEKSKQGGKSTVPPFRRHTLVGT